MRLTQAQLEKYNQDGVLLLDSYFSTEELDLLHDEIDILMEQDVPSRVLEKDGKIVRALHGCHQDRESMEVLTRQSRMLEPAMQILNTPAYNHQFKINIKEAFGGDVWPWHQDFIFWQKGDGMPKPEAVNVAIFLDEVNEFNGPLYFIPGSHKRGKIEVPAKGEKGWQANVSAALRYTVPRDVTEELVKESGMVAPHGKAGSILIFHPNAVHGSVPNISPMPRKLLVLTYNSVKNLPHAVEKPRPEFLASTDYTPLQAVAQEGLLETLASV